LNIPKEEHLRILDQLHLLLQATAKGDQAAFAQLYEQLSPMIYNTALSHVQIVEEAEEITQDVFVKIFRSANQFKGNSRVSTWAYRMTMNQIIDYSRRKKRIRFLSLFGEDKPNDPPDFEHPGVLLERKEDAKLLFKHVYSLPEKQKSAFIFAFVEQLPRQEIADIMEMTVKGIESLLQRAKSNLRKKITNEGILRRISD